MKTSNKSSKSKALIYAHHCSECLTIFNSEYETDNCPDCNSKTVGLIDDLEVYCNNETNDLKPITKKEYQQIISNNNKQKTTDKIEELKEHIDNLEQIVYEECINDDDEFDETSSPYYLELEKARNELNKELSKREQVDFELLRMTITDIGNHKPLYGNQYNNLKLFFNTLANNTSFAHKTSKELQKLLNK